LFNNPVLGLASVWRSVGYGKPKGGGLPKFLKLCCSVTA
jgi:hypothetical protein